jgi:hypothetical protein
MKIAIVMSFAEAMSLGGLNPPRRIAESSLLDENLACFLTGSVNSNFWKA